MANTPRLNLYLPQPTDLTDVTNHLSNQLGSIDDAMDAFVCTSTTRPTGSKLFDGKLIYETNTGNLSYWDVASNNWIVYSNGRKPLGRLGYVTTSAGSGWFVSGTAENGPYLSITFTAKKNREYAVHFSGTTDLASGSPHNVTSKWIVFRAAQAGSVNIGSTLIHKNIADLADNGTGSSVRQNTSAYYYPNVNSTVTVGVFLQSTGGNGSVLFNASSMQMFAVEDLGYRAV